MKRSLARVAVALFLVACASKSAPSNTDTVTPASPDPSAPSAVTDVPVVEEIDYLAQLQAKRPDLYASDCYDSLVLKPEYRASVLDGTDSYTTLETKTYAAADKTADADWVARMQAAQVAFCQETPHAGGCNQICTTACAACPTTSLGTTRSDTLPVRPAGYSLCAFVGYLVNLGTGGTPYDTTGQVVDWKIFFEFGDDFRDVLTPETYVDFSNRLANAGFRGDSKIPMQDGQVRFQYNDIIVHGHAPGDAKIAERVGLEMFGPKLRGHGRGLDVATNGQTLDWHHYLCAEGTSKLSSEALAYVRYEN